VRNLGTILISLFSFCCFGQAVKSPVAKLVGNAYTSRALDNYSLFYNPAAIGPSKLVEVYPINPLGELSNVFENSEKFKGFPSSPVGVAERIIDIPLSVSAQGAPGLKFGPIAFNAFLGNETSMILRNQVYPQLDISYRFDRGFIFGFASSWGNGGKYRKNSYTRTKKATANGKNFSIGAAVKYIDRQSLDGNFSLFGTKLYSSIVEGSTDLDSLKETLGFNRGKGFGFNLGALYSWSSSLTEINFGASLLDAFGTKFKKVDGETAPSEIPMQLRTGFSFKQTLPALHYILSVDAGPVLADIDWKRKLHVGFELGIPLIDFFMGWSEGYMSYGFRTDFWIFNIIAGLYGQELGVNYSEQKLSQFILQVELFSFDFGL
tara:strand:- start:6059 stop:7189 length:1131 start_codon:yes stop_codon:yes gene_type:complete